MPEEILPGKDGSHRYPDWLVFIKIPLHLDKDIVSVQNKHRDVCIIILREFFFDKLNI